LPNQLRLEFLLNDFLIIDPAHERTISFDWQLFQTYLKDQVRQFAVDRCQEVVEKMNRQLGEGVDHAKNRNKAEVIGCHYVA